ncbi:ubiquitin--protein ligase [Oesophagostomum dentatum]|uniref:Ubiquitin--protein ligase n=1 Tax=Oesophagostomum dentatum TaxID=61180 RepID=A0A0B1SQS5_OESDE|nr:ubiquitin--protein ligase [Oesophagostomum dentatum]
MEEQYNTKSAGVKRLMKEAVELREPTEMYSAQPLEDNLFEWHFTVRGPLDSDFDGGIYHGRILFPPEYPMKPPNLIILTPNGRFELNKKICLSISGYHPETWLPSWSIRTALLALIGFMPTAGAGALGSLEYPVAERKKLAKKSLEWKCKECGACMKDALKPLTENAKKSNEEAKELASQLSFKDEEEKKAAVAEAEKSASTSNPDVNVEENKTNGTADGTAQAEPVPTPQEEVAPPAEQPPQQVEEPSPPASQPQPSFTNTNRSTLPVRSESYMSLFITVPICIVFLSLFALLLARRFLLKV